MARLAERQGHVGLPLGEEAPQLPQVLVVQPREEEGAAHELQRRAVVPG